LRDSITTVAAKEIGYSENPINSNRTKYGKWFGFDGVPWCAMFVSWCYDKAKFPLGNIGFTKGFAGCQTGFNYFTKKGWIINADLAKSGDIVLFDWNNDGRHDHTGIFVRKIDEDTFEAIEGNTSLKNQSNGGSVMRRHRQYSQAIFIHPKL